MWAIDFISDTFLFLAGVLISGVVCGIKKVGNALAKSGTSPSRLVLTSDNISGKKALKPSRHSHDVSLGTIHYEGIVHGNSKDKTKDDIIVTELREDEVGDRNSPDILPKSVIPSHYEIKLIPGATITKENKHMFYGLVDISIHVVESTDVIYVNARELFIDSIDLIPTTLDAIGFNITQWKLFPNKDILVIYLPVKLEAESNWILRIMYKGIHSENLVGFYRIAIHNKEETRYMFTTMFEEKYCCMAVPCWDEPAVKCTFSVELEVPPDSKAISNMEVLSKSNIENTSLGPKKIIKFKKTPVMSTYLLSFVIGHLTYLEGYTKERTLSGGSRAKPIRCRVYASPEHINNCKFSLDTSIELLQFYEEFFNIPYPLNKLDHVAVPEFGEAAVENWGLIIYRESELVHDPIEGSFEFEMEITNTMAHEIAHQWLGNLVTMKWWNDIWLNEGFANFVASLSISRLHPSWGYSTNFVIKSLYQSISMDSLKSTHQIDVPVISASEASQIFDEISYGKSASILRMICFYMGYDVFKRSLQNYIGSHKYSNATSDNVWEAFESVRNDNLKKKMEVWLRRPGFPLISIEEETYDTVDKRLTLKLTQRRYYYGVEEYDTYRRTVWWIPLQVVVNDGENSIRLLFELDSEKSTVTFPYNKRANSYWKLNADVSCFCMVKLNKEHIENLCGVLANNRLAISVNDRVGIIIDSYELSKSGDSSFTYCLDLIKACKGDSNYYVLNIAGNILSTVYKTLYSEPNDTLTAIRRFTKDILHNVLRQVGYDRIPGESSMDRLKRSSIIGTLVAVGDVDVVNELSKRYIKYVNGDKSVLSTDIRQYAFTVALKYSTNPTKDFNYMLDTYSTAKTPYQSIAAIVAIGVINSTDLIRNLVYNHLLNNSIVKSQDVPFLVRSLAEENTNKKYANVVIREFTKGNLKELYNRYSTSPSIFASIITAPLYAQIGHDVLKEFIDWLNGSDLNGNPNFKELLRERSEHIKPIGRVVNQSTEYVMGRTIWAKSNAASIKDWLRRNNYWNEISTL